MRERLLGILSDMEQDPQGFDIIDVDKLLRDSGFECFAHTETLVYSHPDQPYPFALPRNVRYVPASVVVYIARNVRLLLESQNP